MDVSTEKGVILGSLLKRFFTSAFVYALGTGAGSDFLSATPLFHTNFFPDLMHV